MYINPRWMCQGAANKQTLLFSRITFFLGLLVFLVCSWFSYPLLLWREKHSCWPYEIRFYQVSRKLSSFHVNTCDITRLVSNNNNVQVKKMICKDTLRHYFKKKIFSYSLNPSPLQPLSCPYTNRYKWFVWSQNQTFVLSESTKQLS
jgi:hypothetical protein